MINAVGGAGLATMGNAGGFSSLSPSTPSTQHGANVDANDGQLQEISRNLDGRRPEHSGLCRLPCS